MHHGSATKKGRRSDSYAARRDSVRATTYRACGASFTSTSNNEKERATTSLRTRYTRISSSDFSFFHLATARPEVRSGSLLPDVALFYSFLLVGDTRIACLRATRPTSKLWRVSQNFNIALVKIAVVFCRNRYVCVYVCVHTLAVALGRTRVLAMPLPIA